MKLYALGLLFILLSIESPAASVQAMSFENLNDPDKQLYQETLAQCRSGNAASALFLSLNLKNLHSSFTSTYEVTIFKTEALQQRLNNNFLSERTYTLKNSPGFWLAFSHCYGYQYGKLTYGNLMKQLLDMGFLVNESTALISAIVSFQWMAPVMRELILKYNLAFRFIVSGLISLKTQQLYQMIRQFYWTEVTETERETIRLTMDSLFSKFDEDNSAVLQTSLELLKICQRKLSESGLASEKRWQLHDKCSKLAQETENQKKLIAKFQQTSQVHSSHP